MSSATSRRGRSGASGNEEEHVNHERWLVTYADTITLLMVLFIVLFAISQVDQRKFDQLATGMAAGFGQPMAIQPGIGSVLPTSGQDTSAKLFDALPAFSTSAVPAISTEMSRGLRTRDARPTDATKGADDLDRAQRLLEAALRKSGLRDRVVLTRDARGLTVTVVVDDLVFAADRADLRPAGRRLLAAVAPALRGAGHDIVVEGHTNSVAVHPLNYPSEWELSSARASAVVRYLIGSQGLRSDSLSVAGYADTRPLLPATDPRSVTLNRRVAIVVLNTITPPTASGGTSHG
jgi:chemotaxis protein MotB